MVEEDLKKIDTQDLADASNLSSAEHLRKETICKRNLYISTCAYF